MKPTMPGYLQRRGCFAKEYELAEGLENLKSISHYSLGTNNGNTMTVERSSINQA